MGSCAVALREAFRPNGRGGWVRPPPRPPAMDDPTTGRAPLSAFGLPSARAGGERENGVNVEEDICNLARLLTPCEQALAGRTAAAATAGTPPPSAKNSANHTQAAAAAAAGRVAPVGRWLRMVRRLFSGRGDAPPPQPPSSPPVRTQEENDSIFLNPFSPNSSRRFSTCSVDGGAGDGYWSGYSGYESGGGAAAASRLSKEISRPMADFNFEERVIGCIFGEEDGATARDDEAARGGKAGWEDRGESRVQELEGGGEKETSPFSFPPPPSPRACLVPDSAGPLPAAVDIGIDGCGGDGESTPAPATCTAPSGVEGTLTTKSAVPLPVADPGSVRSSSTCSTASSGSAVSIVSANAATSAAASAAIAEQASLAAHVAAATAKQARDAFRFNHLAADTVVGIQGGDDNFSTMGGAE